MLKPVVTATVIPDPSLPEQANDLYGLLEHFKPLVCLGPAVPENVLVQRLALPTRSGL